MFLDATLHSDFKVIMQEMSKKVCEDNVKDSFRRLFWEKRLKATDLKDSRQIRWHPAIIKWCLHLNSSPQECMFYVAVALFPYHLNEC